MIEARNNLEERAKNIACHMTEQMLLAAGLKPVKIDEVKERVALLAFAMLKIALEGQINIDMETTRKALLSQLKEL